MSQRSRDRAVGMFLLLCVIGVCTIGAAPEQSNSTSRKAPQVVRCAPSMASVDTVLDLEGYRLGILSPDKARVHFVQGGVDYLATIAGGEGDNVNDKQGEIEHLDVNVPRGLISGLCQITVEVEGLQSAPITIEIIQWKPPEITAVSPLLAQPGDIVSFEGSGFHITDDFVLIDAQGRRHQFEPSHAARYSDQTLPTDLPEGEATLYIVNRENPSDPPSRSFKLQVSRGPIPLDIWPSELMSVAPGQWLDLVVTTPLCQYPLRHFPRIV
jgi:hypothetical protein